MSTSVEYQMPPTFLIVRCRQLLPSTHTLLLELFQLLPPGFPVPLLTHHCLPHQLRYLSAAAMLDIKTRHNKLNVMSFTYLFLLLILSAFILLQMMYKSNCKCHYCSTIVPKDHFRFVFQEENRDKQQDPNSHL